MMDLLGNRFDKLVATNEMKSGKRLCICDCSNEVWIKTGELVRHRGSRKSCGCKKSLNNCKRRDISREKVKNKKFKYLFVTDTFDNDKVLCICDCGNEVWIKTSNIISGNSTSCGCYRFNRMDFGEGTVNRIMLGYKKAAERKNIEFSLTRQEFKDFIDANCFYCSSVPSTYRKPSNGNYGGYTYNGIDRVNNSLGYTKDNCVTCCEVCNKSKRDMTIVKFKEWVKMLVENFYNWKDKII